jgi:hypothetical protein
VQKDYRQKDNAAAENIFLGLGLTLKPWPGYVFYRLVFAWKPSRPPKINLIQAPYTLC